MERNEAGPSMAHRPVRGPLLLSDAHQKPGAAVTFLRRLRRVNTLLSILIREWRILSAALSVLVFQGQGLSEPSIFVGK